MRSAAESACPRLFSFPRRGQPLCEGPGRAQLSAHRAASAPPRQSVPDKRPSTLESQRVLRFQSVSHLSHLLIGTPHARRLHERARFKAPGSKRGRQEMSAFCVYAAATWIARERAEKKVCNVEFRQGVQHVLTLQEWKAKVDEETQRIFKRMKPVRASPLFDIPQSCLDWIRVAEKNGLIRDAQVMAWKVDTYSDGSPARDKHGRPNKAWLSYHATDAGGLATHPQAIAAWELAKGSDGGTVKRRAVVDGTRPNLLELNVEGQDHGVHDKTHQNGRGKY